MPLSVIISANLPRFAARSTTKSYRAGPKRTMGTIIERKRKDGAAVFSAQIVIKRDGKIVHRESATFSRRQSAAAWLEKRETALSDPGGIEKAQANDPALGAVIDRYVSESRKAIGKTKAQCLETMKGFSIAGMKCSAIKSHDITEFAAQLSRGARKPQTVQNYLSHLGAVFALAKPAWGYPLNRDAMREATAAARHLGLTSKGAKRERRPTVEEMAILMDYFERRSRYRPSCAPMRHIVAFAMFSGRRMEEITRMTWADLDEEHSRVMVRDMKHPGDKAGNDIRCDLPAEALGVIRAMRSRRHGKTAEIFPYSTMAIGAAFTRACKFLEIEDLHFHDLRHEGVSRLFEKGLTIPQVASVSGHRDWKSLQRYAHLHEAKDKWSGAAWLASVGAK